MRRHAETGRQDNSDEAVANAIREMITENAFKEHERITESDLSRRLGASRTPVRMALKLLHAEGLLNKLEGRGYRARQFSDEALRQATEVRGVLEGLAAQRLAYTGISSLNRERLDKSVEATSAVINRGIVDAEAIEHLHTRSLAAFAALQPCSFLAEELNSFSAGSYQPRLLRKQILVLGWRRQEPVNLACNLAPGPEPISL